LLKRIIESTQDYNILEEELDTNVDHSSEVHNTLSDNDCDEVSANDNDESGNA
jgi:hypothetical protein